MAKDFEYTKEDVQKFEELAEQGVPYGYAMLSKLYRKGYLHLEITKNENQAYEYASKAYEAEKVYVFPKELKERKEHKKGYGHYALGSCLLEGIKIEKDVEKGFKLTEESAAFGNPHGQNNLGLCYENGFGTAKDERKAVECYEKAAEQEYGRAQYNLAELYNKKAIELYKKAEKKGIKKAGKAVKSLTKNFDVDDERNIPEISSEREIVDCKYKVSLTISEMRRYVLDYIEIFKNVPLSTDQLKKVEEIANVLCDQKQVVVNYLGYIDKVLLQKLMVSACAFGHEKLVKTLSKEEKIGIDINSDIGFPLEAAIKNQRKLIVEYLINDKKAKTFISSSDVKCAFSALEVALKSGNIDIIASLLKYGCSMREIEDILQNNIYSQQGFNLAISHIKNCKDNRKKFLKNCEIGDEKSVQDYINGGGFIDADDMNGRNALFIAIESGKINIVNILLNKGAQICYTAPNSTVTSSLEFIIRKTISFPENNEYFHILKLLFQQHLQVQLVDSNAKDHITILGRMVSTLLYKNKRYDWSSEQCLLLRKYINYYSSLSRVNGFPEVDSEKSIYEAWFEKQVGNYESYPSDDSDFEEETLEDNIDDTTISYNEIIKKSVMQSTIAEVEKVIQGKKTQFEETSRLKQEGSESPDGRSSPLVCRASARTRTSQFTDKESNTYVAAYRGCTYSTSLWNKDARKNHRMKDEIGKPLYSMATLFETSNTKDFIQLYKFEDKLTDEELEELSERRNLYSKYLLCKMRYLSSSGKVKLELPSSMHSIKYPGINMINNIAYDNLGDLLQSVYTTNYDLYFKLLGSDFFRNRLLTHHSPYFSSAETPYHALKYAYGLKSFPGHDKEVLNPSWDQNGRSSRPYSGKVYVVLNNSEQLKDVNRLVQMLFAGRCQVPKEIAPERELSYFSFIDGDRVVYQHLAKYPSFVGYKEKYKNKYGLDKTLFDSFKNYLTTCLHNNMKAFKNLLGEYLCAYHEIRLVSVAMNKAKELRGKLVYLDEFGKIRPNDLPSLYTTPYGNMRKDTNQYACKGEIIKKMKERKTLNTDLVLNDDVIFSTKKTRTEKFISLIRNMNQNKEISSENVFFNIVDENQLTDKVKAIQESYTTLLHYSIANNVKTLTRRILDLITNEEIDLEIYNIKDKFGNSVLHLAVLNGDTEVYDELVSMGSDNKILNHLGFSPLSLKEDRKANIDDYEVDIKKTERNSIVTPQLRNMPSSPYRETMPDKSEYGKRREGIERSKKIKVNTGAKAFSEDNIAKDVSNMQKEDLPSKASSKVNTDFVSKLNAAVETQTGLSP